MTYLKCIFQLIMEAFHVIISPSSLTIHRKNSRSCPDKPMTKIDDKYYIYLYYNTLYLFLYISIILFNINFYIIENLYPQLIS